MARLALFHCTAGRRSGAGRRSLQVLRPALALGLLLLLGASGCGMNDEKAILMAAGGYGDIAIALSDEALRPATERFLGAFNPEVNIGEPLRRTDNPLDQRPMGALALLMVYRLADEFG